MIRSHPNPQVLDVVFVDGLFRASCLLKAASVLRDDAVIVVHDYPRRRGYHVGVELGILLVVAAVDSIVVMQRTFKATKIDQNYEAAKITWQDIFDRQEKLDNNADISVCCQ